MKGITRLTALMAAALVCASGVAIAQDRRDQRDREPVRRPGVHLRLDQRYHHDHWYPQSGYVVPRLPERSISIGHAGHHYFFNAGVWFTPFGGGFIVTVPPIGIVVPVLPPSYATLWIDGAPYYYANGVYYAPAPMGFTVVAPPPGSDAARPAPPPPAPTALPEPIVYPRNGQSAAQTEADRRECERWATTQPSAMADASVFQRAVAACMDARGYTVR
jgi:hypothetical protein